ncbi:3-oxoacyl-[acyl-carrier-protein] synthase III C-terminal domain-containing protein [Bdellovibrionota bacterium FG-1]
MMKGRDEKNDAPAQHTLVQYLFEIFEAYGVISKRTQKYNQITGDIFKRFYLQKTPEVQDAQDADVPAHLIHVTCTGYASPSSAQRLVSERGWGSKTSVLHAYHMGCYAAIPAVRIARGLTKQSERVDIVHTEVCSLHLDVSDHSPEQLVVQSLFADGFVKYSLETGSSEYCGLEVIAIADEILPDSESDMTWTPSEAGMRMTLSREVPEKVMKGLSDFLLRLFKISGLDYMNARHSAVFAIHPGGPKIIDAAQRLLKLEDTQVAASRKILFEYGNMSSATLPHIWNEILQDKAIREGTLVVSLAFGPGLTIYGCLLKKREPSSRDLGDYENGFVAS